MLRRLFFALPAQSLATELQDCQHRLNGEGHRKPVKLDNFHLTLHFLGLQDDRLLPKLYEAAEGVHGSPFEVTLDQYGLFRHARCLWLGSQHIPAALLNLVDQLGSALKALDLPVSADYRPHITLFRHAHGVATVPASMLNLPVSEFILYESSSSGQGVCYTPLQRWPLVEQSLQEKQQ